MGEEPEFEGGVFSATIEGGRAGARIALGYDAVRATTSDAQFQVPYADCQVELGGASGRMWFCRTKDRSLTLFSEAPGFGQALKERARRELGSAIEQVERERAASTKRTTLTWLVLLALFALALLGGYFAIRQAGRSSVDVLPRSVDEQLGKLALEHMQLGGEVVEDAALKKGVSEVVDRLARQAGGGFSFKVTVVDSATVNAFALPGGFIVVYTGLIRNAESPAQLAGVLAHEMAHVTLRHGMRRIAQSVGIVAAIQLLFGDVSGLAAIAMELLREGAINSYSRDQEREADMQGVQTLRRAHIDPAALADFFALLAKKQTSLPAAIAWLGTHPDLNERIATVRRESARQPTATQPFKLRWDELQRLAGKPTAQW
jgi:predicted Zn-dependent protease